MKHSGCMFIAAALSFAATSASLGQVTAYEVIDLGVIPGAAPAGSKAFSINALHEIVGEGYDSNAETHAAVWLWCPNYGLSSRVWHDLTQIAGESGYGRAQGINDAGLVVGGQTIVGKNSTGTRPYVWDLFNATYHDLSTFYDNPSATPNPIWGLGEALGVNNSTPAEVVGGAQHALTCDTRAFQWTEGTAPTAIVNLGVSTGDTHSFGADVNAASPPHAVGRSDQFCVVSSCSYLRDGTEWDLSGPTVTVLPDSGSAYGAEAWGINDAGHSVGMLKSAASPCLWHASFWPSLSTSPVDLGVVGVPTGEESTAYKLNQAGAGGVVTVVGTNGTQGSAIRWYRDSSGTWTGVDLNTLISPLCDWSLVVAYDVSDDGWIVGFGGVNGETHGFLLRPIVCIGDLNHDCIVDGADLGMLLSAWSNCTTTCVECNADINIDGVVNGADLGALLVAWHAECDCCPGDPFARSGNAEAEAAMAEALALLGFDSIESFNNWRSQSSPEQVDDALGWLVCFLTSTM